MKYITIIVLAFILASCGKPNSKNSDYPIKPFEGQYVVGRMVTDNGAGMDPMAFSVSIYKERIEWIISDNTSTSKIISVSCIDSTATVNTESNTFTISKIQNGISIHSDKEKSTLYCSYKK